jgi:O-acetyl-ADP-ribose deacetylase (regulator of RNase III)
MASSSIIPHIHLLCVNKEDTEAFKAASVQLNLLSIVPITHHNEFLSDLDSNVKFNCIVSPANSYGRLDGGFDGAISEAFSPAHDYLALTRHAQVELYKQYRGFAPPGTCTIVPIPKEFAEQSRTTDRWGCRWLALCPTMKVPSNVNWDREVIYECVWSLLCAIDRHNQNAKDTNKSESLISSILMTPFATATGRWSSKKWAHQAVLALKHFTQAVETPAQWSSLNWGDVSRFSNEVAETHTM